MIDMRDGVAVVYLNNPPVNSLGHLLRSFLAQAIDAAENDDTVCGIVLAGSKEAFSAGADIKEFGTTLQLAEPMLRTLIARVESCRKPVVAAIEGVALGGGLELAMACHGRVALASSRLGLPEISLGLIPGSGGTQRLPRLTGVKVALAMMLSGQTKTAHELAGTSLLDHVVESSLLEVAANLVRKLASSSSLSLAATQPVDAAQVIAAVEQERARLNTRQMLQPAYAALLDAVTAVTLPIKEGLQRERTLFLQLLSSTAAQALRYQFKAEREATRLPNSLQAQEREIRQIAVIGAGTMGTGIAISALDAGFNVLLLEQSDEALQRGLSKVVDHYASRIAAGKESADRAAVRQSRLVGSTSWSRLSLADLVIEAVFEDLEAKQEVFKRLDVYAKQGAILATNTSYLDIDAIASTTSRPWDVVGMHFFSPAQVMKLLEVVRGAQTSSEVLSTAMAFGRSLKKLPVLSENSFGFIGNRIYNAYRRQCEFMLEDGAYPEDIDQALTAFGFAMGPFAVADLSGLDIAWRMRQAQSAIRNPKERYVAILDRLCEIGRLGRKIGAGYYTYLDGKKAKTSDAKVRAVIDEASAKRGIVRRTLLVAEIQRRALLAMANEAALLLAEGVAARPGDVDVVLVQGYGFPRWEGGPMHWALNQDPVRLEIELNALAQNTGHGFVKGDFCRLGSTINNTIQGNLN